MTGVGGRLAQRRLRTDGLFFRLRFRRRGRALIQFLRVPRYSPGKGTLLFPGAGFPLFLLLTHRVHGVLHDFLHGDWTGRFRKIRRGTVILPGRGGLPGGVRFPGIRLRCSRRRGILHRRRFLRLSGGGRRIRRAGLRNRFRGGGPLHVPHQLLLPAASVFREDFLQGELRVILRNVCVRGHLPRLRQKVIRLIVMVV